MEIVNILNSITADGEVNLNELKQAAHRHGFKFKYTNGDLTRLIFYVEHRPLNPTVARYCNGMVCELFEGTWHCVCMPLAVLEDRNGERVDLTDYAIMEIYDATMVNIYYSKQADQWQFGTKRSFNIIEQSWRGVEYKDILANLMPEIATFDKDKTYVYAVTDPRIHLFAKVATFKRVAVCNLEEIEMDGLEMTVAEAMANIKNAMTLYHDNDVVCLGYIFRNGTHSYAFETNLMRKIKKILYRPTIVRKNGRVDKEVLAQTNDLDYIIVRAYFHHYRDISLFKVLQPLFQQVRGCIDDVANAIIDEAPTSSPIQQFIDDHRSAISAIKNQCGKNKKRLWVNLHKFIFDNKNTKLFLELYKNKNEHR